MVRMWLPDRPGALGQVASRIGAVRGEIVGIDILERGAGRAIDELVVELPDDALVELLVHEVQQVDGVDVEEVRPVADALHDPRLDALETAAILVGATDRDELIEAVVAHAKRVIGADWAAAVALDDAEVLKWLQVRRLMPGPALPPSLRDVPAVIVHSPAQLRELHGLGVRAVHVPVALYGRFGTPAENTQRRAGAASSLLLPARISLMIFCNAAISSSH